MLSYGRRVLAISRARNRKRWVSSMDVTVTRMAANRRVWALTDLLGRPMVQIIGRRGPGYIIKPDERAQQIMSRDPHGPFGSLEDALRAIERRLRGVCRWAPNPDVRDVGR